MHFFRVYLKVIKLGWERVLLFRMNFLMEQLRSLILMFSLYYLYASLFRTQGNLFGFDSVKISTYIILSSIVANFVFNYQMHALADSIADGKINSLLLKPISIFWYHLARGVGERIIELGTSFVTVALFLIITRAPFFLQHSPTLFVCFVLVLMLATALFAVMESTVGLLAFWLLRAHGPRFLFQTFLEVLSGKFFPLTIFPAFFVQILKFLPFGYVLYFPISVYFGLATPKEIGSTFGITILWISTMSLLYVYILKRGLKVYGAYGS